MTNEEILEGNKLIAKFLDISVQEVRLSKDVTLLAYGEEGEMPDYTDIEYFQPNCDWNELISVVEYIETLGYYVMINRWTSIYYGNGEDRIKVTTVEGNSKTLNTWKAVTLFINEYNQNGISTDSKTSNGE